MEEAKYLTTIREALKDRKVCIFPMGTGGRDMRDKLSSRGIQVDFFCDNNKNAWGTSYHGTSCIPYPQLTAMNPDELVVIIESSAYYEEIRQQLTNDGIPHCLRIFFEKIAAEEYVAEHGQNIEERVRKVLDILEDETSRQVYRQLIHSWYLSEIPDDYFRQICSHNQYFEQGLISLGTQEVFVDCGAYTGDSAKDFLKACQGNYKKMHLFELDSSIYKELLRNAAAFQQCHEGIIQCYPYGVSDRNAQIEFMAGERNSSINQAVSMANGKAEKLTGSVKALDDILAGEEVTFIKMDIEGAEHEALMGARKLIETQKPILAICIYHSPQDMLELPLFLKKLHPEYKIYIRHYTEVMFETVCYAIP